MAILCRNFYTGNTVDIARSLVDCYLVRRYEGQLLVCRITETEAYVGAIDKAAHSYGYHKTARNRRATPISISFTACTAA